MTIQRQDDFLRELKRIAQHNRTGETPDYGLAVIIAIIERRLPQLKPVAYENADLSAGLSGDGIHHICGDNASINRVRQAIEREAALEPYPRLLREAQERLATAEAKLAALRKSIVTTYEIDVEFIDGWKRQEHPSWGSHDEQSAKDSAWMITRVTGRAARVVKVETIQTEEILT